MYQLIIFNIVQNAIKYNKPNGQIIVSLKLIKNHEFDGFLETSITDTGYGILNERIPFLFEVFAEIKQKQSMKHVKDRGIGVGLSCSKILTEFLKG